MPAPFGAGISVCQRTCTVAHIGGRRAGPRCPAAQGDTDPPCLPLRGRWQREALAEGVCRGERLCPPVPCHSEPVRTLAWESVSPCLPLRGRWQREALAEGEIPHGFLSPSRLRRQPPPRGGLTARHRRADGTSYPKGICSAALHGRTPSPTRGSTYRPVGRYPHRPAGINAHSAAGHMGPALQGVCVRTDRVDEPARSQISEGGLV